MRWIVDALTSSVGRKIVLGLTGLLLVAFLVEHLHGNLKLYEGGEAFDEYVDFLQGFGPLLVVGEVLLAALFVCHVVIALRLTLENRDARRTRYAVRNDRGAQSFASISMHVTGILILLYLIKHLIDFRFNPDFFADPSGTVDVVLSKPLNALVNFTASLVVGVHLWHGFRSAFQSIGASHPKYDPWLVKLGRVIAVLFALGFASFPVYYLLTGGEG